MQEYTAHIVTMAFMIMAAGVSVVVQIRSMTVSMVFLEVVIMSKVIAWSDRRVKMLAHNVSPHLFGDKSTPPTERRPGFRSPSLTGNDL